jgi:hypothetical protein
MSDIAVVESSPVLSACFCQLPDDIRPLKEPSSIGKALTEEEKQQLLKTDVLRPEWETAYLAAILCLNTTARGCELWCDVDLFARTLTIRKSKTAAGERAVPLKDVAVSALGRLRRRTEGAWGSGAIALCIRCLCSQVHLQRQTGDRL